MSSSPGPAPGESVLQRDLQNLEAPVDDSDQISEFAGSTISTRLAPIRGGRTRAQQGEKGDNGEDVATRLHGYLHGACP